MDGEDALGTDAGASRVPTRFRLPGRVIDLGRGRLLDAEGNEVELRPQAWQVLCHLAAHAGRLVSKDELLAAVWPGLVVTDDSVVQAIGDVRRALDDAGHRVLKTVPRRGYMLLAAPEPGTRAEPTMAPAPRLRLRLRLRRPAAAAVTAIALVALAAAVWPSRREAGHRAPHASSAPAVRPSIAVLAFGDPTGDAEGALLARSIAEDLIGELARATDMRVVSHQSSFFFSGGATPLAEIGRRLRSRYVVDGTVRRDGERLRITVQLLDSDDGRIVWSSSQQLERDGLAAARQALVARIAGSLQTRLRLSEERRALERPPRTLDAVVLTQRGKAALHRYSADGMREARRFLDQAIALDPDFAPAWVHLAIVNTVDCGLQLTGEWPRRRLGEVMAQVDRAIALDPESPTAYVARSQVQAMAGHADAALAAARQCFAVSPNEADCFYILGKTQIETGDAAAAVKNLAEALDRNPVPPAYLPAFYATALWGERRFADAVRVADECLTKAPDFWRCRQDRLVSLVQLGRLDDVRDEAARLKAQLPGITAERFGHAFIGAASGLPARRVADALAAGIPAAASVAPTSRKQ